MEYRFYAASGQAVACVKHVRSGRIVAILPDPVFEKEIGEWIEQLQD